MTSEHQTGPAEAAQFKPAINPAELIGLTPPPEFKFDPDILESYEEQVRQAVERAAYQAEVLPSFEGVPTLDIAPTFNPTGALDDEIFARNRMPQSLRPHMAMRSDWSNDAEPVEMWRIVERSKLEDGTGLVSSRILNGNSLGDVENFDTVKHLASHDEGRMGGEDSATPFVSFSTDPKDLAKNVILKYGFGIKGGRDSVVVRAKVDADRVITGPNIKNPEVLLLGGVAPNEYVAAYAVEDFISQLVPEDNITTATGDTVPRNEALAYWAQRS